MDRSAPVPLCQRFVGRWSMVDVFVVTVLVALGHLGGGRDRGAAWGRVFAGVVVLTCWRPGLRSTADLG